MDSSKLKDTIVAKLGESPEAWRGFSLCMQLHSRIHELTEDDIEADQLIGWTFVALISDPDLARLLMPKERTEKHRL